MAKRSKGEGYYRQRPDGLWEVRYYLPTGQRKSVYGKTLREAKGKHKEALTAIEKGIDPTQSRMTLSEFLDLWLDEVVKPNRAPRTHASYFELCHKHIIPRLGKVKLCELTPAHVADLLRSKEREGKSPRTIHYIRSVLVNALGRAEKWSMVSRNVARLTDAPPSAHSDILPMTPEQARTLLAQVEGDRIEALYRVALSLGLRQGEALGLQWSDIDFEAGTLRVRRSLQRLNGKLTLKDPKTEKSKRTLTMPASLVTSLRAHRDKQSFERKAAGDHWRETELVFTTPVGGPIDSGNLLKLYRTHLTEANLPMFRFHDLRHSAASLLLAQGISPQIVQAILGHAHYSTTMDIYGHIYPEAHSEAAAVMDAVLNGEDAAKLG